MSTRITSEMRLVRYREQLALPVDEQPAAEKAALDRSHDLRRFEIENYWRRSTYVWGLQLVAFAALALSSEKGRFHPQIVILVASLGIVSSLAAVLTSKGSRFWQKNWESHVDLLEDGGEGRLHKTVLAKNGKPSHSVSRVNEGFLEVLMTGWIVAFVAAAITVFDPTWMTMSQDKARYWQVGLPALFVVCASIRIAKTKSELSDRLFDLRTMIRARSD